MKDIILGGLLPSLNPSGTHRVSRVSLISVDKEAIDPFVHSMHKFSDLDDSTRQQICVMCINDNIKQPIILIRT